MKNHLDTFDDDFGFSAISAKEYESKIAQAAERAATEASAPVEEYKQRLQKLESMIVPFLEKLKETGDKEYIYWPNRKPKIEKQIEAILKLTRG
jgi:hypothetical protein